MITVQPASTASADQRFAAANEVGSSSQYHTEFVVRSFSRTDCIRYGATQPWKFAIMKPRFTATAVATEEPTTSAAARRRPATSR